MKFSISQHRIWLENTERSVKGLEDQVNRLQIQLVQQKRALAYYREQVKEAERRGMDGFDADRFMKSQAKRVAEQSSAAPERDK